MIINGMKQKIFNFIINDDELKITTEARVDLTTEEYKRFFDFVVQEEMNTICECRWGPGRLSHVRGNKYRWDIDEQ